MENRRAQPWNFRSSSERTPSRSFTSSSVLRLQAVSALSGYRKARHHLSPPAALLIVLLAFPQLGRVFPPTSKSGHASHFDCSPWFCEVPRLRVAAACWLTSCPMCFLRAPPRNLSRPPGWPSAPVPRCPGLTPPSTCSAPSTPCSPSGLWGHTLPFTQPSLLF